MSRSALALALQNHSDAFTKRPAKKNEVRKSRKPLAMLNGNISFKFVPVLVSLYLNVTLCSVILSMRCLVMAARGCTCPTFYHRMLHCQRALAYNIPALNRFVLFVLLLLGALSVSPPAAGRCISLLLIAGVTL
jgi:hypothetical protein